MLFALTAPEPFPTGLIAWVLIGLVCAVLARLTFRGSRLGLAGDLVFGLIGALSCSVPIGFAFRNVEGFGGSMLVAFVGAVVSIAFGRVVFGLKPTP